MKAAENGHKKVVKLLIDKGAKTGTKNKEGKTALQLAQASDHDDVVKYLQSHGAP